MNITLYKTSSPKVQMEKVLTEAISLEGTLKAESSIIRPTIIDIASTENLTSYNFAWIYAFGRFYFVTDVRVEYTGLWTLELLTDVLYTKREQVKQQDCVVERQQTKYNLYLHDQNFPVDAGRRNPVAIEFPNTKLTHNGSSVLTLLG